MSEVVDIPTISETTVIKLKGKGNEFKSSFSDLYVRVKINDDDYFKVSEGNVITENFVSPSQFVLGGEVVIRTLYGNYTFILEPYKKEKIIEHYGVNKQGNHVVKIKIRLPASLNEEQRRIYEEIKKFENNL